MSTGRVIANKTFPGRADSVADARAFVAEHLAADDPRADTAVLLTSEAVTNSLLHSRSGRGGKVTVVLVEHPDAIRIEVVDDGGATVPTLGDDDPLGTGGRGLRLIENLILPLELLHRRRRPYHLVRRHRGQFATRAGLTWRGRHVAISGAPRLLCAAVNCFMRQRVAGRRVDRARGGLVRRVRWQWWCRPR